MTGFFIMVGLIAAGFMVGEGLLKVAEAIRYIGERLQ